MLVEFNDVLSMYALNKVGDSIPPCFTLLDTQKEEETMFPILRTFVGVSTIIQLMLLKIMVHLLILTF